MKKSELCKLCNISRQQIYLCELKEMSEYDILKKYTMPIKKDEMQEISENSFYQMGYETGFDEGYKESVRNYSDLKRQLLESVEEANQKVSHKENIIKDINEKIKNIILKYNQAQVKEIEFRDIDEIYEILKKEVD